MSRCHVLALLCLCVACDSQEKPAAGKTAAAKKKGDDKSADKTDKAEPKADKAEPKAGADAASPKKAADADDAGKDPGAEAKADGDAGAKPAATPLDISHDKSGALARAAAVLEAEGIDNEDLQALSHHAEKLPSNATVCKHLADVHGKGDPEVCVAELEHVIVALGPELYAEVAACLMAASTVPNLDACFEAEKAAEAALHEQKHGEGLDKATCETFFTKFEQLAMEGAGEEKDHVKKALDTVKDDIVLGCMEQGLKAEADCVGKAKSLHELKECAPSTI